MGIPKEKPVLFYEIFGHSYSVDLFALPHNAIRREISDLYDLLYAYDLLGDNLLPSDVEKFYQWWNTFRAFLFAMFEVEELVIFPWISSVDTMHCKGFTTTTRLAMKNKIVEAILQLDKFRQENLLLGSQLHPQDAMWGVHDKVNTFTESLLHYFHLEERNIPRIVEKHYTERDKEKLDKRILDYYKKVSFCDEPDELIVLLTQWMTDDQQKYWVEHNLRNPYKSSFLRWKCNVQSRHTSICDEVLMRVGMPRRTPPPVKWIPEFGKRRSGSLISRLGSNGGYYPPHNNHNANVTRTHSSQSPAAVKNPPELKFKPSNIKSKQSKSPVRTGQKVLGILTKF